MSEPGESGGEGDPGWFPQHLREPVRSEPVLPGVAQLLLHKDPGVYILQNGRGGNGSWEKMQTKGVGKKLKKKGKGERKTA